MHEIYSPDSLFLPRKLNSTDSLLPARVEVCGVTSGKESQGKSELKGTVKCPALI